ncbi:paf-acetylhydrolase family member [Colletotrichum plurivorum]|uniref:Putative phospholipase n=1 Tax=Colletotrichum plurivorum TaxID=2175906 RepID=A0A8H6JL67_9PEZI|nr:paf-acetylhydrolase family member [Colletotrichum plurivorum]
MAITSPPEYGDAELELEPLADPRDFEDPDSPLPFLDDSTTPRSGTMENTPKWMRTAQPWNLTLQHKVVAVLRPRLTWGYAASVLVLLYIPYCLITSSPLLASKLPEHRDGRYAVGAIDVEVPVRKPRSISETTFADGTPAFALETVLFTLYYPAPKGVRSTLPRHPWIPRPRSLTAEGYAKAARFDNFISRPVFTFALWAIAGSVEIPAEVDVPLDHNSEETFPVVVLSHGQASSRTDYTHYCSELASQGVVVAALEHRDGSAPGSVVTTPDGEKRVMYLHKTELYGGGEMEDDAFKAEQLDFRQAEIEETVAVLQSLNAGHGDEIFEKNARKEGNDFPQWENRLNTSQIIIAGHSLGATGALQALKPASSNQAIGGIIFDPGKSSGKLNTDISVPLLIVHSASWSKTKSIFFGRPHFDTVKDLAQAVLQRTGASWFVTSLETSHPSVTDAPLIEPLLLRWTTGATIDAKRGVGEYVDISMDLFEFVKSGMREGVLGLGVTHEEYGNDSRTETEKVGGDVMRYWQVHVAPPREKDRTE